MVKQVKPYKTYYAYLNGVKTALKKPSDPDVNPKYIKGVEDTLRKHVLNRSNWRNGLYYLRQLKVLISHGKYKNWKPTVQFPIIKRWNNVTDSIRKLNKKHSKEISEYRNVVRGITGHSYMDYNRKKALDSRNSRTTASA